MIVLRVVVGRVILTVISAYAPQRGRPNEEKEEFWIALSRTVAAISSDEKLIVCGDKTDMRVKMQRVLKVCMVAMGLVRGMLKEKCC